MKVAAVPRDVLLVKGPDAATYLQGQLSQDVAGLEVGASAFSLLLQPQGKVDAWLRVTRTAHDTFALDVDAGWGEHVLARLKRFLLRVKVELEPVEWDVTAVVDGDAEVPPGAWKVVPALGEGFDVLNARLDGEEVDHEALRGVSVPEDLVEAGKRALSLVRPLAREPTISGDRVLVASAEGDRITKRSHAEALAAHFGAEVVVFPGAHLLQFGRRDAFAAIARFLARRQVIAPRGGR